MTFAPGVEVNISGVEIHTLSVRELFIIEHATYKLSRIVLHHVRELIWSISHLYVIYLASYRRSFSRDRRERGQMKILLSIYT